MLPPVLPVLPGLPLVPDVPPEPPDDPPIPPELPEPPDVPLMPPLFDGPPFSSVVPRSVRLEPPPLDPLELPLSGVEAEYPLSLLELPRSRDEPLEELLDEPLNPPLRELCSEPRLEEPLMPSLWLSWRSAMLFPPLQNEVQAG